jgi:hypothetical protein
LEKPDHHLVVVLLAKLAAVGENSHNLRSLPGDLALLDGAIRVAKDCCDDAIEVRGQRLFYVELLLGQLLLEQLIEDGHRPRPPFEKRLPEYVRLFPGVEKRVRDFERVDLVQANNFIVANCTSKLLERPSEVIDRSGCDDPGNLGASKNPIENRAKCPQVPRVIEQRKAERTDALRVHEYIVLDLDDDPFDENVAEVVCRLGWE